MSDEKYNPIQAPITGRFSSGAGPRYQELAKVERTLAARDAVYGAAVTAFRLPSDAPTVEELIDDIRQAHSDTLVAAEKRNTKELTEGQFLAVDDLVYVGEGDDHMVGTVMELSNAFGSYMMKDYPPVNDWIQAVIRFPVNAAIIFASAYEHPSYSLHHQRGKSLVRIMRVFIPSPMVDAVEVTVRNLRFKEQS